MVDDHQWHDEIAATNADKVTSSHFMKRGLVSERAMRRISIAALESEMQGAIGRKGRKVRYDGTDLTVRCPLETWSPEDPLRA